MFSFTYNNANSLTCRKTCDTISTHLTETLFWNLFLARSVWLKGS